MLRNNRFIASECTLSWQRSEKPLSPILPASVPNFINQETRTKKSYKFCLWSLIKCQNARVKPKVFLNPGPILYPLYHVAS